MKHLRSTLTLFLLLTTILLTYLYATSWLFPQCLAAWKLDDSCMLATHHGSLWLVAETDDSPDAPSPTSWTFRLFSANPDTLAVAPSLTLPSGSFGSTKWGYGATLFTSTEITDAFSTKRSLLKSPLPALPTA